jgi:hypothetical protein
VVSTGSVVLVVVTAGSVVVVLVVVDVVSTVVAVGGGGVGTVLVVVVGGGSGAWAGFVVVVVGRNHVDQLWRRGPSSPRGSGRAVVVGTPVVGVAVGAVVMGTVVVGVVVATGDGTAVAPGWPPPDVGRGAGRAVGSDGADSAVAGAITSPAAASTPVGVVTSTTVVGVGATSGRVVGPALDVVVACGGSGVVLGAVTAAR